jgi:PleD family two-component response regulator
VFGHHKQQVSANKRFGCFCNQNVCRHIRVDQLLHRPSIGKLRTVSENPELPSDAIWKPPLGSIVVVEADPSELLRLVKTLQTAGYQVRGVSQFDEAKRVLADAPPSLLIAGVRLGAYNGLHLILRGRIAHPEMNAILTNHVLDPVLKAEAERQRAVYLLRPWTDQTLLGIVERSLTSNAAQPLPADGLFQSGKS